MKKRAMLGAMVLAGMLGSSMTWAQDSIKIGLILPMTGPFASTGKQIEAAARLYMAQNGTPVAGKKVELIVKDDTAAPDVTKRLAQELVVNEKVQVLAGFGLTPLALSTAPIATQSKTPLVVMAAATSSITQASPYIVRTSFTLPQAAVSFSTVVKCSKPCACRCAIRTLPRSCKKCVISNPTPCMCLFPLVLAQRS